MSYHCHRVSCVSPAEWRFSIRELTGRMIIVIVTGVSFAIGAVARSDHCDCHCQDADRTALFRIDLAGSEGLEGMKVGHHKPQRLSRPSCCSRSRGQLANVHTVTTQEQAVYAGVMVGDHFKSAHYLY